MKKITGIILLTITTLGYYVQAQVAPFKKGDKVAITEFKFVNYYGLFNEQTAVCCGGGSDSSSVRTIEAIVRSAEAMLEERFKTKIEPTKITPNDKPKIKFKDEANSVPTLRHNEAKQLGYDKFIKVYVEFTATMGAGLGIGILRLGSGKAKMKVMCKVYDGNGKTLFYGPYQTAKGDEKFKVRGFMLPGESGAAYFTPKQTFPGDEYVILFQEAFSECLGLK
jgi:hypothetical protein